LARSSCCDKHAYCCSDDRECCRGSRSTGRTG
jgi:hypothetical protein